MCKLMESVIKDQLVSYLLSKGLISKQQHAFIKRHSTVTNLLECTHDWAAAVHGGNDVDIIYIHSIQTGLLTCNSDNSN